MTPLSSVALEQVVSIHVEGIPVQQGSKTPRLRTSAARGTYASMFDDNAKRLTPWRKRVTGVAAECLDHTFGQTWEPILGPVSVRLLFAMPRPKSAPKRRRIWPAVKPDIDKLTRAVLDSLTAARVWKDDAQIVHLVVVKDYPGVEAQQFTPGVRITVSRIHENGAPTP